MLTTVLAVCAATWGVVMAVAPLLQLRRMLRRRSAADVSIGYLALLLPGFCLWVGYGIASGDIALVVPNTVAAVIAGLTVAVAVRLRHGAAGDEPRRSLS
ncbi:SemiSWEET family transporter [Brachybacterium sp. ACRRE]|uniref:SemiSWEET family transporter n=1 Tax=Brachybacterium sp. ACRRE TaxID=2918184 RepID=UPI001EF2CBDD|nr:SemiSWEET family transporter [Brachybacterium sp. ACRRE]